eukprot:UN12993
MKRRASFRRTVESFISFVKRSLFDYQRSFNKTP